MTSFIGLESPDLFSFDKIALQDGILLESQKWASKVEYDEYAVYRPKADQSASGEQSQHDTRHVIHKMNQDTIPGARLLDLAFRQGHYLDAKACLILTLGGGRKKKNGPVIINELLGRFHVFHGN